MSINDFIFYVILLKCLSNIFVFSTNNQRVILPNIYLILFYSTFLFTGCVSQVLGQGVVLEVFHVEPPSNHRPVFRCEASGANFGEDVMTFSFGPNSVGCTTIPEPMEACSDVVMPTINGTGCNSNFAIVKRGTCSFSEKAYYVQTSHPKSYDALIIYNDPGQSPIPMSGSKLADKVVIPVVMIKYECMENLINKYSAEKGFVVTLKASPGYYDLIKYLVPFVAIVGFCFTVLFISLVIRLCRERRRLARKRLSRSNLKKIPTKKYKKGDPEETCAICLEDFQEGDKLRILACRHAYHCKCVDPWLTKNRKVCPVCKRKVGPKSGGDSSDSDSENGSTPRSSGISPSATATSTTQALVTWEHDPLLRNAQPVATNSISGSDYFNSHHQIPASSSTNVSENNLTTSNDYSTNTSFSKIISILRGKNNAAIPLPEPASQPPQQNIPMPNDSVSNFNISITDLHSVESQNLTTFPATTFIREKFSGIRNFIKKSLKRSASQEDDRAVSSNMPHILLDEEDDSITATHNGDGVRF